MSRVKIGWASRDVSTSEPLNIPGQFFMRISKGVMDPVTVTALAVENGGQRVIFVSGDMIDCRHGLLDEVRELVKEKLPEIDPEEILMAVTHAHTGEQVDDMTAQSAAADHQDMLALQQQALFFGQGRDVPLKTGLHISRLPLRGRGIRGLRP